METQAVFVAPNDSAQRACPTPKQMENMESQIQASKSFAALGRYFRSFKVASPSKSSMLLYECMAEFWGTMMIVIFGVGSIHAAVVVNAHAELWHVAMMWGFGVAVAIYCTASVSGGHLNPALSLAFAIFRPNKFPWTKLGWYWLAQILGGTAGGAMNLLLYQTFIERFEGLNEIDRGSEGSELSAMVFGEYFPNPSWAQANRVGDENMNGLVRPFGAFCVEAWMTGILMFVVLAVTDDKQKILPRKELAPFIIGLLVSVLVGLYGPLTMVCVNPARDFGPRVVAAIAGWDSIAFPGPRDGFWVYILGPMVGASLGALAYVTTIEPGLRLVQEQEAVSKLDESRASEC